MENKKQMPYLIITAGATGSGKTKLMNHVISLLQLDPTSVVQIRIDDLVENHDEYRQKVTTIIQKVEKLCEGRNRAACKMRSFQQPTDDVLQEFNKAYFSVRGKKGCDPNYPDLTCDEVSTQNLTGAVANGRHIGFETTGEYIPEWLMNSKVLRTAYNIVFTYSLVSPCELVKRNVKRALNSIKEFSSDPTGPAPRLPNIRMSNLLTKISTIRDTVERLLGTCVLNHDEGVCGNRRINRLLIYDNNKQRKALKLLYDSADQHRMTDQHRVMKLVDQSLFL